MSATDAKIYGIQGNEVWEIDPITYELSNFSRVKGSELSNEEEFRSIETNSDGSVIIIHSYANQEYYLDLVSLQDGKISTYFNMEF